jgi:hypothetical protein
MLPGVIYSGPRHRREFVRYSWAPRSHRQARTKRCSLRASVGHTCVGSCHSVRRGGPIDRCGQVRSHQMKRIRVSQRKRLGYLRQRNPCRNNSRGFPIDRHKTASAQRRLALGVGPAPSGAPAFIRGEGDRRFGKRGPERFGRDLKTPTGRGRPQAECWGFGEVFS